MYIDVLSDWHLAHKLARVYGGTTKAENMFPSHIICNSDQGTRSLDEVRSDLGLGPKQAVFTNDEAVLQLRKLV